MELQPWQQKFLLGIGRYIQGQERLLGKLKQLDQKMQIFDRLAQEQTGKKLETIQALKSSIHLSEDSWK